MKKALCILTALCLCAAVPAMAAEELTGRPVAEGVVTAARYLDVTAPMSGTLDAFDLEVGDTVEAGQGVNALPHHQRLCHGKRHGGGGFRAGGG